MTVIFYKTHSGEIIGHHEAPRKFNLEVELRHWGPGTSAIELDMLDLLKRGKVIDGKLVVS